MSASQLLNSRNAADAWAEHIGNYKKGPGGGGGTGSGNGPPPPRPGDWLCQVCKPKRNNFARQTECFKCGAPKGSLAKEEPVGIRFGVRGDSFLQTKHDTTKLKKTRNFKRDFETSFWDVFGNCEVDYEIQAGECLGAITQMIMNGPSFDILCVGVGIQDLMDQNAWDKIAKAFPATLEQELQNLALAIKSKAGGSMVWVGAPAEFWGRKPAERYDAYLEHARNTLRAAGIQVVPEETVAFVMNQMTLSKDETHILNNEHEKEIFAKGWATCLYAAASDPTWGLAITAERDEKIFEVPKSLRDRSRSPPPVVTAPPVMAGKGKQFDAWGAWGFKGKGKGW